MNTVPNSKQDDLADAIEKFPLMSWLQQHFRIRDSGRDQMRIDCPICRGNRTLSISLDTKQFHCFRCDDGGLGAGVWNGRAKLFTFVRIVENLSPKATAQRIRSLAGVPDAPRRPAKVQPSTWPRESISLAGVPATHPSVKMLVDRGVGHLVPHCKVCVDGEYSYRVLIPCNFFGVVTGFEAKTYVNASPKSLLCYFTGSSGHVYTSRNWDSAVDFCVVTESILDAETLGVNAIGLYGSVLRDDQVKSLIAMKKRGVRKLVWFLDSDAIKKQANIIQRKTGLFFDNFCVDFEQANILLRNGADPNSLGRDLAWSLVRGARPIVDALSLIAA
jgi:hypothetical protein